MYQCVVFFNFLTNNAFLNSNKTIAFFCGIHKMNVGIINENITNVELVHHPHEDCHPLWRTLLCDHCRSLKQSCKCRFFNNNYKW